MRETRPRHANGHHSGQDDAGAPAVADPLMTTPLSGEKESGRPHGADSPVEVVYVERAYARRSSVAWGDGL